jgi:hypothetical protein
VCVTDKVPSRLPCSKLFCLIIVTAGGRVCLHVLLLGCSTSFTADGLLSPDQAGKTLASKLQARPAIPFQRASVEISH